ncbi:MAG: MFS transporter [Spirochaetia bacterium]|jgi:fucose permease|nr:MFS transporter [Spirochaetia bacterium]
MAHITETLVLYGMFVIVGLAAGSLGPAIPAFAELTGETISRVGMLFVFYRCGYMAGSLGGGRVLDRLKGGRIMGFVLFSIALMLFLLSFAANLCLLFAFVLFLGLGLGLGEVGGQRGIIRLHGMNVGPYMNGLHLSYCIGAVISPLVIAAFLQANTGLAAAFRILAALAALAGFVTLRLLRGGAAPRGEAPVLRASPFLVFFFAAMILFSGGTESGFSGWIYSYALRTGLAGESLSGILTAVFWGAMTFGRVAGIYLVRRFGSRRLLLLSSAGAVFSLAGLVFFPSSTAGLWISTLLVGLFQASIIPVTFTLAGEQRIVSGFVAGIFVAASSFGGMVFSPLAGYLMQSLGLFTFPLLGFATQILTFISFLAILWVAKR